MVVDVDDVVVVVVNGDVDRDVSRSTSDETAGSAERPSRFVEGRDQSAFFAFFGLLSLFSLLAGLLSAGDDVLDDSLDDDSLEDSLDEDFFAFDGPE